MKSREYFRFLYERYNQQWRQVYVFVENLFFPDKDPGSSLHFLISPGKLLSPAKNSTETGIQSPLTLA
jgi:hypothetical protein